MNQRRHPDWIKVKIPAGKNYKKVMQIIKKNKLHTVCQEANCPNMAECFCSGTATFMILGDVCTRNCGYCNVKHGNPSFLDENEAEKVADAAKKMKLRYAVVTSVTRDDIEDGGASVFAECIKRIKENNCRVEVLIPDFGGNINALKKVVEAEPDVLNHNIEVVKELFPEARPEGDYNISIQLLKNVKRLNPKMKTKSGLMIGLGETGEQIIDTLRDLRNAGVDFLTIGQYLQPTEEQMPIAKYYKPEEFSQLRQEALKMGFSKVESGPLVRSSYHAEESYGS